MNPMDVLSEGTYQYISNINVALLAMNARMMRDDLNAMLAQGIITEAGIEEALKPAVINQGIWDYHYLLGEDKVTGYMKSKATDMIHGGYYLKPAERRFTRYVDHAMMPEALVFAFDQGTISKDDLKKLYYDHGNTADTFPDRYRNQNLIPKLREKLLKKDDLLERVMAISLGSCGQGHCDCWEHH